MTNIVKRVAYPAIILSVVALIFYLDRGMMIGPDTTTYMDFSYVIHKGGLLFVDYYDYRLPVFPYIFSFVFNLGFSDLTNRFIMHFSIYSFYTILVYIVSNFLTKSRRISLLISLITLVTITTRQLDSNRNIAVPLFYHSLELLSVFLFIPVFTNSPSGQIAKSKKIYFSILSGLIFSLAFWGRQVHIFPFLMISLFLATNLLPRKFRLPVKHNLIFSFSFISAFALGSTLIISIFNNGSPDFFINLKKWLTDVPRMGYLGGSDPLYDVLLRRVRNIIIYGLTQFENLTYPIFWVNFIASVAYLAKILFSKNKYSLLNIVDFCKRNSQEILLVIFIATMAITSLMGTGYGNQRHVAPIISFHAIFLSFVLGKMKFEKNIIKNPAFALVIIVFILPQAYIFWNNGEKQSYATSRKQEKTEMRNYKIT